MSDNRILEKIAKLLAAAEGTTNREEAEAFSEKAQHLAATYAIDLELARYHQKSKEEREELTSERVAVGEPGREFKNRWWVDLFLQISQSNDLRCTIAHDRSAVHAYGYPSDIGVTKMLFASLNTQMVGLCNHALQRGDHKALGVHGKTYRLNFYEGFIEEIGFRLRRARADAHREQRERDENAARLMDGGEIDEVVVDDDGQSVAITGALVMMKKTEVVKDYYAKQTRGSLSRSAYRSIRPNRVSYGASEHGRQAGARANLGGGGALPGAKKAING